MKTEKFKVVDYIRMFIKALSANLDNFPKKEYELKDRIKKNSYDILEIAYEANSSEFIELKLNLINKMLAKIKLVDYLLDLAVDMNLLSSKKYLKLSIRLGDIEKYSRGWMESIKKDMNIFFSKSSKNIEDTITKSDSGVKNRNLRSYKENDIAILSEKSKKSLEQLSLWNE